MLLLVVIILIALIVALYDLRSLERIVYFLGSLASVGCLLAVALQNKNSRDYIDGEVQKCTQAWNRLTEFYTSIMKGFTSRVDNIQQFLPGPVGKYKEFLSQFPDS